MLNTQEISSESIGKKELMKLIMHNKGTGLVEKVIKRAKIGVAKDIDLALYAKISGQHEFIEMEYDMSADSKATEEHSLNEKFKRIIIRSVDKQKLLKQL